MGQRGRPRSFDRTLALDKALIAFWRGGFEATSMSDLVAAMGINAPSIYAAFRSKDALFVEAVQRYNDAYAWVLFQALKEAPDAAAGLRAMFEAAVALFTRPDTPGGCFVVNSVASNSPRTLAVQLMLKQLRREQSQQIAARLSEDVEQGRLRNDTPIQELAGLYTAMLQGLAHGARDGLSKPYLRGISEQSQSILSPWIEERKRHPGTIPVMPLHAVLPEETMSHVKVSNEASGGDLV